MSGATTAPVYLRKTEPTTNLLEHMDGNVPVSSALNPLPLPFQIYENKKILQSYVNSV